MSEKLLRQLVRDSIIVQERGKKVQPTQQWVSWLSDLGFNWSDVEVPPALTANNIVSAPVGLSSEPGAGSYDYSSDFGGPAGLAAMHGLKFKNGNSVKTVDIAEYITAAVSGGKVQGGSTSYDVVSPNLGRIEVKKIRDDAPLGKAPKAPSFARTGAQGITASSRQQASFQDLIRNIIKASNIAKKGVEMGGPFSDVLSILGSIRDFEVSKGKTIEDAINARELTSKNIVRSGKFVALITRLNDAVDKLDCNLSVSVKGINIDSDTLGSMDKEEKNLVYRLLKKRDPEQFSRAIGCEIQAALDHPILNAGGNSEKITKILGSITGLSDIRTDPDSENSSTSYDVGKHEALKTQLKWFQRYLDETGVKTFAFVDMAESKIYTVDAKSARDEIMSGRLSLSGITQGRPRIGYWPERNTPVVESYALISGVISEILKEELTKADKKEIDKLIKKGIEKDRTEQKKLIQKELEAELKKSLGQSFFRQPGKIRKTIQDVCRQELAKEMQKGSDLEKSVVAVTKKVLSAWHELLYKQQHIIQRVKI